MIAVPPDRLEVAGGEDPAFRAVLARLEAVAGSRLRVVLTGPSGVGKTHLAQWLHDRSGRRGRFVVVDCPAIEPTLFASELFGHARGAFTGADRDQEGLVEAARGGTLFLEEVGDLSRENQARLLSFLGSGRFRRIGSTEDRSADVRIVAATNRPLDEVLRADFLRRIADEVVPVPALDRRPLDIGPLAERLALRWARIEGWRYRPLSDQALMQLVARSWPENVAGLERAIHRALLAAEREGARVLLPHHFDEPELVLPSSLEARLDALERLILDQALRATGGGIAEAARALGISRQGLYRRIDRLGVARPG